MKQANLLTENVFYAFVVVAFIAVMIIILPRLMGAGLVTIPGANELPTDPDDREEVIFEALEDYLESLEPGKETCYEGSFDLLPEQKLTNIFYALKSDGGDYYLYKYEFSETGPAREITRAKINQDGGIKRAVLGTTARDLRMDNQYITVLFYHSDYYWHHSNEQGSVTVPDSPYIVNDPSEQYSALGRYYYTEKEPRFFLFEGSQDIFLEPTFEEMEITNRDLITTKIPDCG